MGHSKHLTIDDLRPHFHLPIKEAARELRICPTVLKKVCRVNNIPRWPQRKLTSIKRMISCLEESKDIPKEEALQEVEILNQKLQQIIDTPSVLVVKNDQKPTPRIPKKKKQEYQYGLNTFKVKPQAVNDLPSLPPMKSQKTAPESGIRKNAYINITIDKPQDQAVKRFGTISTQLPPIMNIAQSRPTNEQQLRLPIAPLSSSAPVLFPDWYYEERERVKQGFTKEESTN